MSTRQYPLHHRSKAVVAASPEVLFAALDEHKRLAGHMEKPSLMMAGVDAHHDGYTARPGGGLHHPMAGQVLGLKLALDEVVTERQPPFKKTWETCGQPRLLIIDGYRMGFTVTPRPGGLEASSTEVYAWDWAGTKRLPTS
jgi:hypothetical protein